MLNKSNKIPLITIHYRKHTEVTAQYRTVDASFTLLLATLAGSKL